MRSLTATLALALVTSCAAPRATTELNLGSDGVALGGFDPVSYFEGGPVQGDPSFTAAYEDATYHFESAAHRDRFAADPAAFAPAYGGWCAWAVAEGYTYEVDPESYLIQDGRLLVFYAGAFGDTRAMWLDANVKERLADADAHWASWAAGEARPPE